jgi:hypothetical protein
MPRANEVFRTSSPIRAKLPTKQYPHLKTLIHECDFACSTCSSAKGQPTYRTVAEVLQSGAGQPISGPGNFISRWGLLCPECMTAPAEGPFIMNGIIDLLEVPKSYKRPERPTVSNDQNLFEEDEPEAPVLKQPSIAITRPKKTSDLHPKTKGTKVKAKALSTLKAGKNKKKEDVPDLSR